jgi:UDP-4-amino-4,6-dideoxy-N-acetyl-beta-L-altrosamine transaminase
MRAMGEKRKKRIPERIPYGRQEITESDIAAVVAVLGSDFLTQGPTVRSFEEAFASYIGVAEAVAVCNGTAALHLGVLALGLKPGKKVITTPITFAASANCVRFCGGEVVFADIDPDTHLIDIDRVEQLLADAPQGSYAGIIPVDFAGRATDLERLRELADRYDCWILEDACHAPGGYFVDSQGTKRFCGDGSFADAAVFSFHPVKHIAAGEGGMLTTRNTRLSERWRNLRTHGIQQDPRLRLENHGVWYYEMQELGFNYRLTDIQAALGRSQLKRAKAGLRRRRQLAANYQAAFSGRSFLVRPTLDTEGHAYHLFVAEFDDRDGLLAHLHSRGIFAQVHYIPLHLMPYYRNLGWKPGDFPNAERYYRHALSLPLYPSLSDQKQAFVIQSVFDYYARPPKRVRPVN